VIAVDSVLDVLSIDTGFRYDLDLAVARHHEELDQPLQSA
jgi:hypothetical protein